VRYFRQFNLKKSQNLLSVSLNSAVLLIVKARTLVLPALDSKDLNKEEEMELGIG